VGGYSCTHNVNVLRKVFESAKCFIANNSKSFQWQVNSINGYNSELTRMTASLNSVSKNGYMQVLFSCFGLSLAIVFVSEACMHWFMIPVLLCGMLLAKDAYDWFTWKVDVFNPLGIVAFLGLHFFYLAPILHVCLDSWMRLVIPPTDWRPWLGYMGILNMICLAIYKSISGNKYFAQKAPLKTQWLLDERRFWFVCSIALLITMLVQVYVYHSFGGILAYIHAYEDQSEAFRGMGWIFTISEGFPILAFMAYAVIARKNPMFRSWSIIILAIVLFLLARTLFGGMRGSRGNIIWALFWAVGIIHFWIRPLNHKIIIPSLLFLVVFMYLYGLYKSHGVVAVNVLRNPLQAVELADERGRTLDKILLGDLGRADVQAYLLYSTLNPKNEYTYKWGATYVDSLMLLLPKSLRPDLVGKGEAGTEAQYGYYSEAFLSSRIYGMAGEAMLNWGIFSIPFAFVLYGLIMGKINHFAINIHKDDVRALFVPFIINMGISLLINDSDNFVFGFIKNGAVPSLVMLLSSKRIQGIS